MVICTIHVCVLSEFWGFRCLYPAVTAVLSWLMRYSPASTLRETPRAPDWRCWCWEGTVFHLWSARNVGVASCSLPPSPSTQCCLWEGSGGAVLQQDCSQLYSHSVPPHVLLQGCPAPVCFSLLCLGNLCCLCCTSSVLGLASLYLKNPKSRSAQRSSDHTNTYLWMTGG